MCELLPLEERAHQGNPDIVSFCRECRENTVPRNGICMWCLVPIGETRPGPEEQLGLLG